MAPFGVILQRAKVILTSAFGTDEDSQHVEDNGGNGCCPSPAPGVSMRPLQRYPSVEKTGAGKGTASDGTVDLIHGCTVLHYERDFCFVSSVGATVTMTVEAGVIERCNGAVVELVPCEDSINGKDALSVPTHGCCMALSELLLSPECLCYAATTSQGFDMKQILGLPAACKFHVKPHQACEGIPIPSYNKPPSGEDLDLAPSDSTEDIPAIGFSDDIREDIKKEFRAHQARIDSLTP